MKNSNPLATTLGSLVLAGQGLFAAELPAPTRLPGPTGPPLRTGSGPSHAPVVSADGRYVAFVSAAPNLVPGDTNGRLDVFRRDRLAGRTELVSVNAAGTGPGNGTSAGAVMSADGRWIAFESRASDLVANDTNGLSDVFLRDMGEGRTVLVSRALAAGSGNGPSTVLQITPDGRFVLFESRADNLVAGDTNAWEDLFLFDREAGTVERVSEPPDPEVQFFTYSGSPALSADGQWIAFIGAAVAPGGALSGTDVYLRDRAAGRTWRVSTPTAGNLFSQASRCSLSADGAVVAFIGPARFVAAENPLDQVAFYRWNRAEQRTYAVPAPPALPNAVEMPLQGPVLNADGSQAVFAVQGHVFVWEAGALEPRLITTAAGGPEPAAGVSVAPRFSPDGRQVWFLSQATNLTATPPPAGWQLYRHDLPNGPTTLVSAAAGGGGSGQVLAWEVTPDGAMAVFESDAPWPEGGDLNADADVFAWQAGAGSLELISLAHALQTPRARYQLLPRRPVLGSSRGEPLPNAVSADGRRLVCLEAAPGAGDRAAGWAIAVVDLESGTNVARLDFPPTSPAGVPVMVQAPQLNADGRVLVFGCSADGLVPGDTNGLPDVFRYEIETGTLSLVSAFEPGQAIANARLGEIALDPGGRYVAFVRVRSGETTGSDLWWRDLTEPYARRLATNGQFSTLNFTGEGCRFLLDSTVRLTSDAADFPPAVPYNCYAWDCRAGGFELVSRSTSRFQPQPRGASGMRAVAAADGRTLAFIGMEPGAALLSPWRLFVLTSDSPVARMASLSPGGAPNSHSADSPGISRDGRRVVFISIATNLVEPGWTSLVTQVFVRHVPEQFTTLVSVGHDGTSPAEAPCTAARISPSGRFVLFRSAASNLVSGDTNGAADWFLRDLDGGVTWRLGRAPEAAGDAPVGDAIWSADSRMVIMEGTAGRLADGSLEPARELWVLRLAGPDVDGDGLDDDWELVHFDTLARDGSGDFDGDGATDRAEFRAGTNPTATASVLRVLTLQVLGGDNVRLLWWSVPGRRYAVQVWDGTAGAGWRTLPGTVLATGETSEITLAADAASHGFFRVLTIP